MSWTGASPLSERTKLIARSVASRDEAEVLPNWRRMVARLQPGVLGDERSAVEESYSAALGGGPEYPHYTRPAEWRGWRVPDVLLSGHHERIRAWREQESRRRADGEGAGGQGLPLP